MTYFSFLLTIIFTFSLFTFVVLFGHIPAVKNTPIGWLHYLLLTVLPAWLKVVDQSLSGGRISQYLVLKKKQVMNERHPSVLILYMVLFTGGVYIYVAHVMIDLSWRHWVALPGLVLMPLFTLYKAAMTNPGYITAQTHGHYMEKYDFDGVLFRRGHDCSTCLREKPARSKHCSLCNHCIAKHDHHCIWINSCVGEKNMKWFLSFLLTNTITFSYATMTLSTIYLALRQEYLADSRSELSGIHLWLYLMRLDVLKGALFLFVALCNAMVSAFLLYHLYLVFSGVTTNETLKFEDIREAIRSGELAIYSRKDGKFILDLAGKPDEVPWNKLENVYDLDWKQNLTAIWRE